MRATIMTKAGVPGPSWTVDDVAEGEALAQEHGYEVIDTVLAESGDWLLVVEDAA